MIRASDLSPETRARMGHKAKGGSAMKRKPTIDPTFNPPGPGIFLRMKVSTQGNNRRHWRAVAAEAKKQRDVTHIMTMFAMRGGTTSSYGYANATPAELRNGLTVKLTRYAPGTLDAFGNLASAFKHVVDGIADAYGVDDRDPRWAFETPQQVKTKKGQYGVRIEIQAVKP